MDNDFLEKQAKDYPTSDQINKNLGNLPKKKISAEERKRIDSFVAAVRQREKKYIDKHYK